MKLTVFLLVLSVISVFASKSYSQTKKLSLNMKNSTVKEVLRSIEEQSEFVFMYSEKLVDVTREVSVNVKNMKINEVLDELFAGTDVNYRGKDRFILLTTPEVSGNDLLVTQQPAISGTVNDESGQPLPGVAVMVKGTTQGTVTNDNGVYNLMSVPDDAILVFSFVGMRTQEMEVGNQTSINITMVMDAIGLEEVVAVGYGTQKKINVTGAVSVAGREMLEERPVTNVQQALQGLVPNLVIQPTSAGGEPGANMSMNIRGLNSFEGNSAPYVLVDGVPMNINDVAPNDIESISVLKDAASSAIYGARAAYGVILITTKRGQTGSRATYSMNIARRKPTIWPEMVETMDYVQVINEAATNGGGAPWWDEAALERIRQNIANPGSAPSMMPSPGGQTWDMWSGGLKSSGAEDWNSLIVNQSAPQVKHNISISGGTDAINYYLSGSVFEEQGLLKVGNESYTRYNIDAKIDAKANSWLDLSFVVKYKNGQEDFPWDSNNGRSWIINWITKIKPTLPAKYDGTDIWTKESRVGEWESNREEWTRKQVVVSPKIILEPFKGWVTNFELNYIQNNNKNSLTFLQTPWVKPDGEIAYEPATRESTRYHSNLYNNEYLSPNIYSTYTGNFGRHNLNLLAGLQQEYYQYTNQIAQARHLLSDAIPSITTAVGEKQIADELGHWATRSYFGRVNYNFDEKYLFEVNFRADGSSKFAKDDRWGTFPSLSAGWVITNENFFPEIDQLDVLKFRASYGTLGNQDVENYLYIPGLPIRQTNQWLFGSEKGWAVGAPNLTSVNLTWEQVSTLDIGFDAMFLGNRLGIVFDWYESHTTNLVGPGEALPVLLGTSVPKKNEGEILTRGWEVELSWKNRVNDDFSYGFRAVLSDYISTVVNYNNPNKLLNTYYDGQKLGEIWGYRTDGLFQTQEEIDNYPYDQSFIWSGLWRTGDLKYLDLDDDEKVDNGGNSADDPGDREVIGNSTPRYMFGISGDATWRNLDASILFQGVGKREVWFGNAAPFRGPASGPFHATVYEEHMDYFRDETSVFGANPDAYFARPYSQFMGQNAKNYANANDRFLQDASFLRLKNITIGYTLPSSIIEKTFIHNARIYLSGENILTFTNMKIFDPEAFGGRWYGGGDAYPLSKTYSVGLTVNF